MAAAALFHTSHILVLGTLGMAGMLWSVARPGWRPIRTGAVAVLGAALLGATGGVLYPAAVRVVRHQPIYAPPFLTMRLIADGPGRLVLRQDCRSGDLSGDAERYQARIAWIAPMLMLFMLADRRHGIVRTA